MNKKLRLVWICHLSNPQIKEHIKFSKWSLSAIARRLLGKTSITDFAQWNTNAIREFEKFEDIELHIVAPFFNISRIQEFKINGVYYHFFHTEDDNIISKLYYKLSKKIKQSYPRNSKKIINIIDKINPDIIHLIGAENPHYGESVLYLNNDKPIIVSLQTLLKDPIVLNNYPSFQEKEAYRVMIETKIITKVDYIGTNSEHFKDIIKKEIDSEAKFLNMTLAVGEELYSEECRKSYDFVYYAANISKAIDFAIEAFAIAKSRLPNITLYVVGGYNLQFMNELKKRMQQLHLDKSVHFSGPLSTHKEVLSEIRKAKIALLPLKSDLISSTIREAMANGLPVVTTITPATPQLNEKRESILLSEKGDFKAMAENMCRLLDDENLAERIRQNAATTISEKYSNTAFMNEWREIYYEIAKK